ncbi:hypothetical protein QR680_016576 [Steinernema hermaphroditum]|uniref:Importin N-terminal domain-containing protein n=1 Tax=Steinernema hermaphroditum TaxID=289476 RepID=A0AA39HCM4_9BILA|nr:hypothetical protein QR680_016576 [Steinernema hermaphroditum]
MASDVERSTVEQVVAAIRSIYDVRKPNAERVEFSKRIEEFKDSGDPRNVFRVAQLIICSSEYDEIVYHAGWAFLEHLITFKWIQIDEALRSEIQGVCFQVLSSGQPLRCNMSLKTAISRCFVGIMQHEWPQNVNVFEGLQHIVVAAPEECFGQIEVVYLVVRRLLENVISMVSINDAQRRRDLSLTLARIMPQFLMDTINRLKASMTSSNMQSATIIAKAALEATADIIECGECGSAKWKVDCIESLVDLLCLYLKHPDGNVAIIATRCLRILVSWKKRGEEEEIIKVILKDSSMQAILENASLAIESSKNNPDCYEYLKAICKLLVALGVKVAHIFEANKEPQNFVLYLSAISVFFSHPSTYIRGESIAALSQILANDILRSREDFIQMMKQRVIPEVKTVFRHSFGLGPTAKDNPFDDYDYDDDREMIAARTGLRHSLIPFLRSVVKEKIFTLQLNEIVHVWMEECKQCDAKDLATECDALTRVIRIAVTCEDEESKAFYSSLLQTVLKGLEGIPKVTSMSTQLDLNFSFLIALISTITVKDAPAFLLQMSETFKMKYESKATCVVKRYAIATLLRMIKTMHKDSLLQIAEPILNLIGDSMQFVSPLQQGEMLQVTAAISNLIPSIETRIKFLGDAVAPITAFFLSDKVIKCVESLQSFMHFSGFTSPGVTCDYYDTDNKFVQNRIQLRAYLTALEGVLNNVHKPEGCSNPLFGLVRPVIPVIFALARCVKCLDHPDAANLLHPSYNRAVFSISKAEKEQVLISLMETMESRSQQESPEEESQQQNQSNEMDCNAQAKTYAVQLNLHVQILISHFAEKLQNDFFAFDNIKEMVDSTIEDIHCIPDIRLKPWFRKTWRSLYLHCPEQLKDLLVPSFIELHEHIRNRLGARWKELEAIKSNNDAQPTEDDIFKEHIVCMLQREFVALLRDVLVTNDKLTFWLDVKSFCDSIMITLLSLITHDDSNSCNRVVLMLNRIVKEKYNVSAYGCDEESAIFILRCALQAYHIHGKDELMSGPLLSLIAEIYVGHRARFLGLQNVIVEATGASPEMMQRFETKMLAENTTDKLRRNIIRDILQGVAKPSTAILHKRRTELRRQPALPVTPKISVEQDFSAVADLFGSS